MSEHMTPVMLTDSTGYLSNENKMIIGSIALVLAITITVATGGTLSPLLFGVLTSTGAGAGIGYVLNGQQGAIDGAVDGFMWGSVFALASSSVSAIKSTRQARQGVVIGKDMNKVRNAADFLDASTYKPFNTKAYNAISKFSPKLADKISLTHNSMWINRMKNLGAIVYDNGLSGAIKYGEYYSMELAVMKNYARYIPIF
jgi:hypothetical protein